MPSPSSTISGPAISILTSSMPSTTSTAADTFPPIADPASRSCTRSVRIGRGVFFVVVTAVLVAWAFATPVFESPDEPAHWQYARYLHDRWSLPFYEAGFEEANSPPLYYLALAPLAVPSRLPPMAFGP